MGFSNEYLTEEEKELIAKTGHHALVREKENASICLRDICTVDKSRNIWLLRYAYGYSFVPQKNEEWFVCFYGGISKDNIIEMCLMDLGNEKDESIKKKYNVDMIKYWSVEKIKIGSKLMVDKNEFKIILEEMMTTYAVDGDPEAKGPKYDGKFKAVITEVE